MKRLTVIVLFAFLSSLSSASAQINVGSNECLENTQELNGKLIVTQELNQKLSQNLTECKTISEFQQLQLLESAEKKLKIQRLVVRLYAVKSLNIRAKRIIKSLVKEING